MKASLKDVEAHKDKAKIHVDELNKLSLKAKETFKEIPKEELEKIEAKEVTTLTAQEHYKLGLSAISDGKFNTALNELENAIRLSDKDSSELSDIFFAKGFVLGELKEYDQAIEANQKALEINPKHDKAYNNMGRAYDRKGEYDQAIEAYQKAVEINPKKDGAYNNMGIAYGNKKEYDKEIEAYQKAVEINPKKDEAYNNMGIAYYKKGEYDQAIDAYEKAIEINPKRDEAYYNMGIAYRKKGEYDQAIEAYQKAIEINPKDDEAYTNLFELQLTKNQPFDQPLEQKYKELFQNKKESFVHYEMLKILQDMVQNQEVNLDGWVQKYHGVSLGSWSFDELPQWINGLEDEVLKVKLHEALKVFEGHG